MRLDQANGLGLGHLVHSGDFARHTVEGGFVKLTLGIGLLRLVFSAVEVADNLGNGNQVAGIENVDLIQIVNRYYSDHNISIFPNPASEVLYLQANVPFEEANLTVTNLLGTKVIQQQIDLSSSPELKLDISFLLPGIYYVNISDGLSSISGKFLKR